MSTPDPAAVPPPSSRSNMLVVGCLVVIAFAGLALFAFLGLAFYMGAKEEAAKTPQQREAEQAQRDKEYAEREAARIAPILAEGKTAQVRLADIARQLRPLNELSAVPCPHEPGRALRFLPVDGEFFARYRDGVPREEPGTPWFRHTVFTSLEDVPGGAPPIREDDAGALARADEELVDTGHVAVIRTVELVSPKPIDESSFDAGYFNGWVQLISYPEGKPVCLVPFSAVSSERIGGDFKIGLRLRGIRVPITGGTPEPTVQQRLDDDFQSNFWTEVEKAVAR